MNRTLSVTAMIAAVLLIVPIGIAIYGQTANNDGLIEPAITNEEFQEYDYLVLYDLLFPNTNVSDEIKQQVIDNLRNSEPTVISVSDDQRLLSKKASDLILSIRNETDPIARADKQNQLDELTIPMLKAGIVVAEKYIQDPVVWRHLLEEFASDNKAP
ncbi:MAG: hypothetical protein EB830_04340 [Nitrosopumilus sp. H13]|nr:MAG: hypothetical protein EB830_04340 [Nitrosopumilus sp. H13]